MSASLTHCASAVRSPRPTTPAGPSTTADKLFSKRLPPSWSSNAADARGGLDRLLQTPPSTAITMSSSASPPNGNSTVERLTSMNRKRFANPLAVSVRVSRARSSSTVMWPINRDVSARRAQRRGPRHGREDPPSHALRMSGERVFPCRSTTASTPANSGSSPSGACRSRRDQSSPRFPLRVHFLISSRTSDMKPSRRKGRPLFYRCTSARPPAWRSLQCAPEVPFLAFELSPTRTANRFA